MSQSPTEQEIEQLLEQLHSPKEKVRLNAVKKLGALGIKDARIITALKELATNEPYASVVEAAGAALRELGRPHPAWESQRDQAPGETRHNAPSQTRDFFIGFLGWFAFNGVMTIIFAFFAFMSLGSYDAASKATQRIIMNIFFGINFLINVVGLVVLGFKRRRIALGALIAFATVLLVVTLIGGLATAAQCFMFFTGGAGITQ